MAGEHHARFVSPARCVERPWDLWVAELGRATPRPDPVTAPPKASVRRARLHRLRRETMPLHGLLPQRDTLRAAVCHLCGAVVRCSAAHRHLIGAHGGTGVMTPGPDPPPPPPPAARRRPRREPPAPPPAPPRRPLEEVPPPAPEVQVRLETGELPVVSIQDPEELPLGDHLTDDIFAIMNSEGIQSADDIASATDWKNIIRDIGDLQDLTFSQPSDAAPGGDPFAPALLPAPYALPDELALRFASPPPPPPPPPEETPRPSAPVTPRSQRARSGKTKFNLREYDANKHCGVVTAEGKPCTRSLTCKAHALSLRRMVEGRAKPFDTLLAEHRASREASAAAASAPPPPPVDLPPLLVNNSIDLSAFNGLTTEQQVNDIYSLLSVEDPTSLLADPAAITSLLSQPIADSFVLPEEIQVPEPAPVERIAPERVERIDRHERPERHDRTERLDRTEREWTSSRTKEDAPAVVAGDVCWYTSCPRPLALCTYNASHAGGAVTLGKKFATVRSNIKSSLSRSQCKSTGGTNNFYYGQSALSLSKSVHMNASKTNKPEVRRLIVCSGSVKDGQTMGEVFGSRPTLNGHIGHSGSAGKARAPLKHKHPAAPVLDLGFSLDPLLADEKC